MKKCVLGFVLFSALFGSSDLQAYGQAPSNARHKEKVVENVEFPNEKKPNQDQVSPAQLTQEPSVQEIFTDFGLEEVFPLTQDAAFVTPVTMTLGKNYLLVFQLSTYMAPANKDAPGLFRVTQVDSSFLETNQMGWVPFYPTQRENPALILSVIPKKLGKTQVVGLVQVSRYNDLRVTVSYDITVVGPTPEDRKARAHRYLPRR